MLIILSLLLSGFTHINVNSRILQQGIDFLQGFAVLVPDLMQDYTGALSKCLEFFCSCCICNAWVGVKFGINFKSCSENGNEIAQGAAEYYFAVIATTSPKFHSCRAITIYFFC